MKSDLAAFACRTDTAAAHGFVRIATARGYTAHARLCEKASKKLGYIARVTGIPSPYRYSETDIVWSYEGHPVIIREVAHRRYEAYALPAGMPVHKTEKAALLARGAR